MTPDRVAVTAVVAAMNVDAALLHVTTAALMGLILSAGIERFLQPRPLLKRPLAAWQAHAGLWFACYGSIALVTGRPWCALAATAALLMTLALVSNAKMRSLREPFIFQDYDYFLDAVRFPRLFLPFFGVKSFLGATAVFMLALACLYYESPPIHRFAWNGQLGGLAVVLGAAALLLRSASRQGFSVHFRPEDDLRALGLPACIWAYARAERAAPDLRSPFDSAGIWISKPQPAPHLVAVQLESFFDARAFYDGIKTDVLAEFDAIKAESAYGALTVPAWGANTVRTEFAFLTGVGEDSLGAHRFNPYRVVARGRHVSSLPMFLKGMGYRVICIHPYWAQYYSRDRVFRRFGFDEFMDIRSFTGARRFGPYVADAEVGEKIVQALRKAACPTFVFAITMENHGPLHLERARLSDVEELYTTPPPPGCDDLTIYLRHLRNTDRMLGSLRVAFMDQDLPVELCCFGDHVPVMPKTYSILGAPDGNAPCLWWSNPQRRDGLQLEHASLDSSDAWRGQAGRCGVESPLPVHLMAPAWLRSIQARADR